MEQLKRPKTKLPWADGQAPGDRFRGEVALNYLSDRVENPLWALENAAVEGFLDMLPDGARVLDVPFGTGRYVHRYRSKQFAVCGIDSSPDMIAEAVKAWGRAVLDEMDIRVGDATSLPFPDASFDAAVTVRFLESIMPSGLVPVCLSELHRVTTGKLIASLHVRKPEAARLTPLSPNQPIKANMFEPEIIAMLESCGWAVDAFSTFSESRIEEKRIWLLNRSVGGGEVDGHLLGGHRQARGV